MRRRALWTGLAVAVLVVLISATRIATFLTDLWWYEALGYRSVFTGLLGARLLPGTIAGVLLAAVVYANLMLTRRLRPLIVPTTPQEAIVERYRQALDPYVRWVALGVAALFGLAGGAAVAARWEAYLLWRNGGEFGIADPQFGRDVGFYVFDLPWLKFLQDWTFTSLLLVGLLTVGAHFLMGGIRPERRGARVTPAVHAHLSVLLAAILLARGWGFWLDRFLLNFSPRGQVTGASYTDVHAELPALNLLLGVTAVAVALVVYNIRRRGWLLPGIAVGVLIVAGIVLSGIYPALVQRLRVDPQELEREREFITRNMEFTRHAWGLDDVEFSLFEVTNDLSEQDIETEQVTLANVRLWDPSILLTTYSELQALRPYYRFEDVDVDRYPLDGTEPRQVMLSARELDPAGLPAQAQTWQNLRTFYTHGFGVVASQVNLADAEGQPVFLARDIPPRGREELVPDRQPGIYYGESDDPPYSVVATRQPELDYETSEAGGTAGLVTTTYQGRGGVPAGNRLKRLVFALRFSDPNLVLSGLITDRSRIIYHRQIAERVQRVAPYLVLDRDPYPVVLDGRILWVQDAYTVTEMYPYSERVRNFRGRTINYVRNSVKAVVDAYHGTVTLYVVDPDDPIVQAWRRAFPAPYADLEDAPEGLRAHFRYPEDMFTAQAEVYRTYHIPDTDAFYSKADAWDIPLDPSAAANVPEGQTGPQRLLRPYYLLMRLPGEAEEEFVLIQPYLARNKPNMIAWLAGRSDPEHFGELFAVQFPGSQTILGPQQAQARIEQQSEVAEFIRLRTGAGSQVIRGNLLVIPIGRSVLYVEPLFIESPQARIPELAQVVLVMGERTVMAPTLEEALLELVRAGPAPAEEPAAEETLDELLQQQAEAFAAAEEALRRGDLAEFQRQIERAEQLGARMRELRGLEEEPAPTETPAPAEGPAPTGSPTPT